MTQAVAYRETQDGQQSQSSGIIVHRGPLSAALVRSIGSPATGQPVWPRDGQGSGSSLELAHTPKGYSSIQSYDRDVGQWLPLNIHGSSVNLSPQGPGAVVTMPQGSAQAVIGQYFTPNGYTLPQVGVWAETTAQCVNMPFTGAPLRIEWTTQVTANQGGGVVHLGVGLDGALTWASITYLHINNPGYIVPVSGQIYHMGPPTGVHRVSIWLYCNVAGGCLAGGANTGLWVTEQRA